MNQTYKELVNIARAENVPYSKTNKRSLVDRIQQYRDTVGTLYREKKRNLFELAKEEGLRGYSQLKKGELIDSILYHRRVVKPRIDNLKTLTKEELRRQAKQVGLKVIGGKKDRIAHNLANHLVKRNVIRSINDDITGERITPVEHEQAMNGAYKSFRIAGRNRADIDSYIALVSPKLRKLINEQLKVLDAAKIQLHMWAMWKKVEETVITLEDDEERSS